MNGAGRWGGSVASGRARGAIGTNLRDFGKSDRAGQWCKMSLTPFRGGLRWKFTRATPVARPSPITRKPVMPRRVSPGTVAFGTVALLLAGLSPPASAADAPNAGKNVYQSTLRSTVWIVVPQEVARRGGVVAYAFVSGSGSLI